MTTLLQAIALSKGNVDISKADRVAVIRKTDGGQSSKVFDLPSIRAGQEPDPAILNDDIIVVERPETKPSFHSAIKKTVSIFGSWPL